MENDYKLNHSIINIITVYFVTGEIVAISLTVHIGLQDKLIVQYFVITIYNYRSQHTGVSLFGQGNGKYINSVSCYVVLN